MCKRNKKILAAAGVLLLGLAACRIPAAIEKPVQHNLPASYNGSQDSTNIAAFSWRTWFKDPMLVTLIDSALSNNQELNIVLQEIEISRNEIRARKGEYLPFVGLKAGAGLEKVGRYTSQGAGDATTEIEPGKEMPDPLPDFLVGAYATWEADIWHKLHNASKAAVARYLSTIEGKNFVVTTLIAEIANSYYELLALDKQLEIINQNIVIQNNALEIVKVQKDATRVTELAVRKFEAEVLKTKSLQYDIQQRITETENRISFLTGHFNGHIPRKAETFDQELPAVIQAGIPAQLLNNRPDIRQAELALKAAKLDVKVARAQFYPSLGFSAGVGYNAFSPAYLFRTPASLLYSIGGELAAPLVNRNAIKAAYNSANAKQVQAVYSYEQTVLHAYIEVANQLANIGNLDKSYTLKHQQVDKLVQSIDISNDLFAAARADYMEVLLTQRDALESKMELVETRKQQWNAMINIYQALGGGWN
ncbi:efflux transporter, outer membrane factor (OMF) lipoprotein, NodT family [Chitinophaga terrae (ex Kim and Jung 2007)]|uniref:Efflux transporter, outer membrane factor (OMF) lipoprotein, NodT family n=1 Tax=Chitinophaga terrae (ex Kim and Jung 2007) TaxID=408074 RepID=A0A1H4FQJ3_9BACT|nr:TolC family protein [Chitinophaga terrae (ex Kim and Jung 2007)]MDQ0109634.1 NodT family efflux transporter outer membrane factor (OMF) lipoprotein [Chitinophaga terrae (ex Kim and Jung 2007)]GEP92671.1 RND transporter [Chitinophaga terrae (ex Kim and Jung 2007)]SEA99596.1 efflux transporter, outer membrane factor (OMF) lipoprotein, NodT family [Chitinophaga terrae (ex Kim and Jung 2007)]